MPGQRKALGRGLSALLGTPDLESDRLRDIRHRPELSRTLISPERPLIRLAWRSWRPRFGLMAWSSQSSFVRSRTASSRSSPASVAGGLPSLLGWRRCRPWFGDTPEHHALELALVENLQREDLNAIDQARAYQRLLSEFSLTQEKLASRVGKSRASVANTLRLLKLPEEVQKWLQEGVINAGHAKALLSLPDADAILESAREIIKGSYSVRQAEALVSKPKPEPESSASGENPAEDPNVRAAIRALERALGTKVAIRQPGGKGKGKIEIHFHSQGELNRLYNGLIETRF